ncbi:coiled-coil domain-containing protein 166-like [Neopelma chrysocephalum]|uniref:coiled-coil domain-containing protein 166-like n=1 Tax=Neopelma chrysocephalum TaxID=114329 RepID=UPI000FCD1E87|nr:coiled-coil domain-containing protein 166-like [Neopelma chrysocephalum]
MDAAPKHCQSGQQRAGSQESSCKTSEEGSFPEVDWDTASKPKGKEAPMAAGKTKEGMRSKDGETSTETDDVENLPKERKQFLQEECGILTEHLDTYLGRTEQLLRESKSLEEAARGTREQSQTFLSCGAKLGRERRDLLITLNERNSRDLAQSQAQKEQLIPQYAGKEQELTSSLRDTEAESSRLDTELEELEPYKEVLAQSERRVKELEQELLATRIRCAEETRNVKSRFLQEKAECERELQRRMQQLTWRAEEVALRALIQHVEQVKAENRRLRRELLGLIQHSQVLRDSQIRLRDQQEQLLRENQCAQRAALGTPVRSPRRRRDDPLCPPGQGIPNYPSCRR